jgi:cold shock CspA family protein
MGKHKRKTPMSERGVVIGWHKREDGASKGFGFIERENGLKLFCHKSQIQDGNALKVGTEVVFDARADPRPNDPEAMMASNVRGGVCFEHAYRRACTQGARCRFSHADRLMVRADGPPALSLEDAVAAVSSGRQCAPPLLVNTVAECKVQCERLCATGAVAVDFEGTNLCRDGELLLAQLASSDGAVVLVDIFAMGHSAFDAGGLRAMLESDAVLKLVFDGRADSDALYHLFNVRLRNVFDCQVLYARHLDQKGVTSETRGDGQGARQPIVTSSERNSGPSTGRLPGLAAALSSCPGLSAAHRAALNNLKKAGHTLFVPDLGGSYDVWKLRPLPLALVECAPPSFRLCLTRLQLLRHLLPHSQQLEWCMLLPHQLQVRCCRCRASTCDACGMGQCGEYGRDA